MAEPRTSREAMIAEMLGDLDGLLARAEQLPQAISDSESKLARTMTALDDAGKRFREAMTASSEQTRRELTDYLQRKAREVASTTVDDQRAVLQEAARTAMRSAGEEHRRGIGSRLLEHGLTALLASTVTAVFVLYVVRF